MGKKTNINVKHFWYWPLLKTSCTWRCWNPWLAENTRPRKCRYRVVCLQQQRTILPFGLLAFFTLVISVKKLSQLVKSFVYCTCRKLVSSHSPWWEVTWFKIQMFSAAAHIANIANNKLKNGNCCYLIIIVIWQWK